MQYNFQEGLLCGLLMIHQSDSYNPNKNYRPLSNPLFKYILDNYTPKVEIIMTPHYTYKYYFDVSPFYSDDDILLWTHYRDAYGVNISAPAISRGGKNGYAKVHDFHKAIGSKYGEIFSLEVWYRDDVPIIGYLGGGENFGWTYLNFHDKSKVIDGKTVYLGKICYPEFAIKDLKITQSEPIGVFEQSYYVSSGKIKKRSITFPEGAVNPATITVTYKRGRNSVHESNYYSRYDENGNHIPNSPEADWSENPIIFPYSFEDVTVTNNGNSMTTAPDFSITASRAGGQIFCEMSPDEFHECELELINQQYEKAKGKYRVYDIPSFLLPKGFTNEDLPPELNRKLPKT